MGTVFLTNLAAVTGKCERYDVLSAILDFDTHNRLPLKKLRLLKTLNPDLNRKDKRHYLTGALFQQSHLDQHQLY